MVLYKRKAVKFEPLPPFLDDNTEVWVIDATDEVFTDYEKYLSRRDFYLQKLFTCESTGHQGYTFFEAAQSELEASKEINSMFPEVLRGRVLEYVQFKRTPRMDDLVNEVYDHFRGNYMVGDRVSVEYEGARRYGVIHDIQDTSRLPNVFSGQPNDDQFRSYTYHITLDDSGEQFTRYRPTDMHRDRRTFSKLILKQFLRSAVSREAWYGASWTVKEHLAKRYKINTTVPEAKTKEAVMAAKKAANAAFPGNAISISHPQMMANGSHMSPSINGHAGPNGRGPGQAQTSFINYAASAQPFRIHQGQHHMPQNYGPILNGAPPPPPAYQSFAPAFPPHFPPGYGPSLPPHLAIIAQQIPPPGSGLPIGVPFQPGFMQYQTLVTPTPTPHPPPPPPRQPETFKYPMEDLRLPKPKPDERPPLKFISDDVPEGAQPPETKSGILMKSVGPLLCAWETLNVHDTIYSLDSFTLDDFVDAMRFSSEDTECELLIEIHCAVLKEIVKDGHLQTPLPQIEESDESDEGSSESPSPSLEPEPPVRTTRSSLRKSEANNLLKQRTPTPEPPKQMHAAAQFVENFNWIDECNIRNFRDGYWQAIFVGLLYQLSFGTWKQVCDEILAVLVPPENEPSIEAIAEHYAQMDVNLRISALDMALQLTVSTEHFRDQLAAASVEMTRLRKDKIEQQKKRKELTEELYKLDNERKIQYPANMPPSPTDVKATLDVSMTVSDDEKEDTDVPADSVEDTSPGSRKLRHTNKSKRKRVSETARKQKAKKAKVDKAKTKQQQEWEALLKAIEAKKEELQVCEAAIAELEDDLRETMVNRSKILGKDRFLNKYYWFEHNGMPFGGVPNSSTAHYGYANGRLWVQGPDEYELGPNLKEPALSLDQQDLGYTVPQRKEKEEGSTHLSSATEWGYYDDPEDIAKLLNWLDDHGIRERALKKELLLFRDRIAEYMVKMKEHLAETEEEKAKAEEEENAPRVSTRTKAYVDKDTIKDRCLRWTNSIMRSENGFSHYEEYTPKRGKRGVAKTTKAAKGKAKK